MRRISTHTGLMVDAYHVLHDTVGVLSYPERDAAMFTCVGKTLAGYKRGRPLPVPPRMGFPLPVLPRIRPRLPRGSQRVTHDGMPRQTSTSMRAIRVSYGDMPSQ